MAKIRVMDSLFLNEVVIRDELSKLRGVLRAIARWEEVVLKELEADPPEAEKMSPQELQWHASYLDDRYYMVHVTKAALFASLSVAAASSVEKMLGMLCKDEGLQLTDRADWGEKSREA